MREDGTELGHDIVVLVTDHFRVVLAKHFHLSKGVDTFPIS